MTASEYYFMMIIILYPTYDLENSLVQFWEYCTSSPATEAHKIALRRFHLACKVEAYQIKKLF